MHLEHFKPEEFREWWEDMSPRLLVLLDAFRYKIGLPVHISLANGSLGRENGNKDESTHNLDYWGEVLAADVFVEGFHTGRELYGAYLAARGVGFTGIGIYTDTRNNEGKPQPMLHLDCRTTEKMGTPATWGRVDGKYGTLKNAILDVYMRSAAAKASRHRS